MRAFIIFLLCASILGCQSRQIVKPGPSLNLENSASLHIFRPSSDFAGMTIDFRVFTNAEAIGSLGAGDYIQRFIKPGKTSIKVQPYTLGFADGKGVTMDLEFEINKKYYIQFNQKLFTDRSSSSETSVTRGGLVLTVVSEGAFGKRK